MLRNVNCVKCGMPGRTRFNRGIDGISYRNWYCPDCRKIARETGELGKSNLRNRDYRCCSTGAAPTIILFSIFIIFPNKYALLHLINFHQKNTSKVFKKLNFKCKYQESCSVYSKNKIIEEGARKGGIKSIKRILSCR